MIRLPAHGPQCKVGLLGGSFDPPHEAHRAISLYAMKRLKLDRIWWMVTPGNPLKETQHLPPLETRMAAARTMTAHDARIEVTCFEQALATSYSYATVAWLKRRCPSVQFVWIMGADNLANFHHWKNWRGIARQIPIAVVDRFGVSLKGLAAPAAHAMVRSRLPEKAAARLPRRKPPAWVFLHGLKLPLSSTALRSRDETRVPISKIT